MSYLKRKKSSLENSILNVWSEAAKKEGNAFGMALQTAKENGEKTFRDGAGKLISERAADGRINKRQNILNNWHNSETILNGKRWTAWGLVQAISELEQHANSGDSEKRTDRLMDRVTKGRVGSLTETAFHKLVNA